ncbi:MAG: alpha-tubulin suppressor-like RCC1 family protein, partial [Myxococcota bacterium]
NSGSVACWGQNNFGQLGIGVESPNSAIPLDVIGIDDALSTAAVATRTCVLRASGKIFCFGNNTFGAFGTGAESDSPSPIEASIVPAAVATCSGSHYACAILIDGTVACWGSNLSKQLGNTGAPTSSLTPFSVTGVSGATDIACGDDHTCVVSAGQVLCWGDNDSGETGQASGFTLQAAPVTGIDDAVAVSVGERHSCAIRAGEGGDSEGGPVVCWGDNGQGQLGDGGSPTSAIPVVVIGLTDATALSAGDDSTCAVRADGTVVCWGRGVDGQLGDGQGSSSDTPVVVTGLTDAEHIAVGIDLACAMRVGGEVSCWGDNFNGSLGDGTTESADVPVGTVLAPNPICGGCDDNNTCTTDYCGGAGCLPEAAPDGTPCGIGLACVAGECSAVVPLPANAVAVGRDFAFVRRDDATLAGFGENDDGQLGQGDKWPLLWTWPQDVLAADGDPLANVVTVSAGEQSACALIDGGQVWCWGRGSQGQLGDGADVDSPTPTQVLLTEAAVDVQCGEDFACALLQTGQVACWGWNTDGQIGSGSDESDAPTPQLVVGVDNAVSVSAGARHACVVTEDAHALCWGDGLSGQLGNGLRFDSDVPVRVAPGIAGLWRFQSIVAGGLQTCAVEADSGHVACWGSNSDGAGGQPTAALEVTPQAVANLSDIQRLAAQGRHTCAIRSDDSLVCWGTNSDGQIGDGTTTKAKAPTAVVGLGPVANVSVGYANTCAQLLSGQFQCWGSDFDGQLGDGKTTKASTPQSLLGLTSFGACAACDDDNPCTTDICNPAGCQSADAPDGRPCGAGFTCTAGNCGAVTVSARLGAGRAHTCFVHGNGAVSCWGDNDRDQLGGSLLVEAPTPVSVASVTASMISTYGDHTCTVEAGTVTCWGYNTDGQLGFGSTSASTMPVQVSNLTDVFSVSAGGGHTCAVTNTGDTFCWGRDFYGQLGNGPLTGDQSSPTALSDLAGVATITTGRDDTCVIADDGSGWCFGNGGFGQVGDGQGFDRARPSPVAPGASAIFHWAQIASGNDHACGLTLSGAVACWGSNANKALGDAGSTAKVPRQIHTLPPVARLAAGHDHTCALLVDQTVRCWGRNSSGQLGNDSTSTPAAPVAVDSLTGVTDLAAGSTHTCALVGTGDSVWCWGSNTASQLGNPTAGVQSKVPIPVIFD